MKRRLFKLCLFLLLGAIFNIAVAWGIKVANQGPAMEADLAPKSDPGLVNSHSGDLC